MCYINNNHAGHDDRREPSSRIWPRPGERSAWTASAVISSRHLGFATTTDATTPLFPQSAVALDSWIISNDRHVCELPYAGRAVSEYGWRAINIEDSTKCEVPMTKMYMTIHCCCCCCGGGFYYTYHLVVCHQTVTHHLTSDFIPSCRSAGLAQRFPITENKAVHCLSKMIVFICWRCLSAKL